MNLYLIGYRGSGKTSVAAEVGKLLGWPWLDADVEIERRAGKTIKQIFDASGEQTFRDLEAAVIADLAKLENHVVALGCGAILREESRQAIRGSGKVIWLQASPAVLFRRISGDASTADRRPNLTAGGGLAEVERLLAIRSRIYAACADLTLDAEQSAPAEIAKQIAEWWRGQV
ncbi:MAG: shikimate kinase [Planctomycetales bacterium]|nr:shikimate kinase [Planctomycetales bacterium]